MVARLGVVAFLALAFALLLALAVGDSHWPGWDDGWVLLAFPLGVPLAVAGAFRLAGRSVFTATVAVWCWGAALFLLWFELGKPLLH